MRKIFATVITSVNLEVLPKIGSVGDQHKLLLDISFEKCLTDVKLYRTQGIRLQMRKQRLIRLQREARGADCCSI